jgi:hypothetical protein
MHYSHGSIYGQFNEKKLTDANKRKKRKKKIKLWSWPWAMNKQCTINTNLGVTCEIISRLLRTHCMPFLGKSWQRSNMHVLARVKSDRLF